MSSLNAGKNTPQQHRPTNDHILDNPGRPTRVLQDMNGDMNWKASLYKAGVSAAFGAAGSYFLLGETASVPVGGVNVPSPVLVGGACGAGSVAADLAHMYVLPNIPQNEKFVKMESAALGLAASGLGTYGVMRLSGATSGGPTAVAIGAASFLAADYTSEKLFDTGPTVGLFG